MRAKRSFDLSMIITPQIRWLTQCVRSTLVRIFDEFKADRWSQSRWQRNWFFVFFNWISIIKNNILVYGFNASSIEHYLRPVYFLLYLLGFFLELAGHPWKWHGRFLISSILCRALTANSLENWTRISLTLFFRHYFKVQEKTSLNIFKQIGDQVKIKFGVIL